MNYLTINKDTEEGKIQIKTIEHFEKAINHEFKKVFKNWMIVKNLQIKVPVDKIGDIILTFQYDEPNDNKIIKKIVKKYDKTRNNN